MPEYEVKEWSGEGGLMMLAHEWATECGLEDFAPEKAMDDMLGMKQRGDSALYVLTLDDKIVGGLGITILDMFYTDEFYSAVRYWYIKPKHRGVAFKLIAAAKRWSKAMQCKKMMLCSNELSCPSHDFLKASKFKKYETVYIRDI